MADTLNRQHPLEGRFHGSARVSVEPAPPAIRVSLRAPAASIAALSKALGLKLPVRPKTSAQSKNGRTAIWLGPDEWLIIDTAGKNPAADCSKVKAFHSAVDVSHRNTAVIVAGHAAGLVLNSGCLLDLSLTAFPIGAATRTVLGKAEIVLLREAADRFRVECWRSFSDYIFTLLADGARSAPAP